MHSRTTPIRISVTPDKSTLSKAQKTFNTLVGRIEVRRQELEHWQVVIERYHQKVAGEMQPVAKKLGDLQVAMLKALDSPRQPIDEAFYESIRQRWRDKKRAKANQTTLQPC